MQAYLTTTYRVDQLNVSIRIGQIDERLEGILEEHGFNEWAFITAYNPFSVPLKEDVNAMRHLQLLRDVSSFTFFEGEGVYNVPHFLDRRIKWKYIHPQELKNEQDNNPSMIHGGLQDEGLPVGNGRPILFERPRKS